MKALIYIGNEANAINQDGVTAIANGLDKLLRTAYETRLEQEAIHKIIEVFTKIAQIGPINISGNSLRGDVDNYPNPTPIADEKEEVD